MPENEVILSSTTDSESQIQAVLDSIKGTQPKLERPKSARATDDGSRETLEAIDRALPDDAAAQIPDGSVQHIEKRRSKGGYVRRIEKLTRKWREAETEVQKREHEIERLRQFEPRQQESQIAEAEPADPALQWKAERATEQNKFKSTRETRFETEQAFEARLRAEREQVETGDARQTFANNLARFREGVFLRGPEIVAKVKGTQVPSDTQNILAQFENGSDVAVYIAENPELVKQLVAIGNGQPLFNKLIKLSHALEEFGGPRTKSEPIRTKAPAPISPVGGNGGRRAVDVNDPNISTEDYYNERSRQRKGR